LAQKHHAKKISDKAPAIVKDIKGNFLKVILKYNFRFGIGEQVIPQNSEIWIDCGLV